MDIKIHGHVSAVKKDMLHTSVLFIGTKALFLISYISITTWVICPKFTLFMLSIYAILYIGIGNKS